VHSAVLDNSYNSIITWELEIWTKFEILTYMCHPLSRTAAGYKCPKLKCNICMDIITVLLQRSLMCDD